MKQLFIIVAIALYFSACTSNTIYKKPDDLIPEDQMVDLMVDIYIANVAVNLPNKDNLRNIQYMPLVYEKYKVDSTRFKKSTVYYMSKIKDYRDISQRVIDKLEILKKDHEATKKIEDSLIRIKSDSIRKVKEAILKIKLKDSLNIKKKDSLLNYGVFKKKRPLKAKKQLAPNN